MVRPLGKPARPGAVWRERAGGLYFSLFFCLLVFYLAPSQKKGDNMEACGAVVQCGAVLQLEGKMNDKDTDEERGGDISSLGGW